MAHVEQRYYIDLTNAVQAITLDVLDPYSLYVINSDALRSVSIPGTTTISTTGTLVDGLAFNFRYIASVTSGNVSIFGENIPSHLLEKTCEIYAYYNGTSWEIEFTPDLSESGVISVDNLVTSQASLVDAWANSIGVSTANLAGEQVLQTVTIPAATLQGAALWEAFRITAWGTFANANLKTVHIKAVNGATTINLFRNNVNQDYTGVFKVEVIVTATPPGVYQAEGIISANGNYPDGWTASGVNFDYSVNQTIQFVAEEAVPAGGLVTLRQLRVEKIME